MHNFMPGSGESLLISFLCTHEVFQGYKQCPLGCLCVCAALFSNQEVSEWNSSIQSAGLHTKLIADEF